jgi:hypothetical protein
MPRRIVPALILSSLVLPVRAEEPAPRRVPTYTNADLERVAPGRGDTGVLSTPASPPPAPRPEPARAEKGEAYWRDEAERLRDRLAPLEEKIVDLRQKIEDRRREPGVRPYTDARTLAWQRRLAALEARRSELTSRFEERARRAGALPGWLR